MFLTWNLFVNGCSDLQYNAITFIPANAFNGLTLMKGLYVSRYRCDTHQYRLACNCDTVQYFRRMGVQMLLFVFISGMHAYVGLIPLFDFKQSKAASTSHPCNHALNYISNVHLIISVRWMLMCSFSVCGLADTDLMVHIVASQLPISQRIARKRHHFDPCRISGHQYSTEMVVRVLEL